MFSFLILKRLQHTCKLNQNTKSKNRFYLTCLKLISKTIIANLNQPHLYKFIFRVKFCKQKFSYTEAGMGGRLRP
ncbi:MAG: hypothetical protein LBH59_11005 [Planctomycetaceae bacterium]|nr:hypothetical protein [Planctomycetaceae bacterium]